MYQLLPALSQDEYEALKADIAARGVQVPVEYDDEGNILDGHHRVRVCRELGVMDWPRIVRRGMTEDAKREHALALNLDRRHLTREQRQELVVRLRESGWSTRRIADRIGHSVGTVHNDLQVFNSEHLNAPEAITGADGKQYPAYRPAPEPDPEPVLPPAYVSTGAVTSAPEPDRMAVHYTSNSVEWYTPDSIIERAMLCMGGIDLDPCSNSHETPNIPAQRHFTKEDDGLSQPWAGRVYMNPPYGSEIADWVAHLCSEYERGAVTEAMALVPARTDTAWFRRMKAYPRCFVWGRLHFSGQENSAPFPSMVVYLGRDLAAFKAAFGDIGDVYRVA